MSDTQLPKDERVAEVELTHEQAARACKLYASELNVFRERDGILAAREIIHLRDENAVLRQWHKEAVDAHSCTVKELIDLRASLACEEHARKVLADENNRLRNSAARYQWILLHPRIASNIIETVSHKVMRDERRSPTPAEYDSGIDTAMRNQS